MNAYVRDFQEGAFAEVDFYRALPTLEEALEWAGHARRPDEEGKRHDHQRRIPAEVLERAHEQLGRCDVDRCRHFDELHREVETAIGAIHGVGELMVYDTALRLGAYLGIEPQLVYLHAGTREGAKALGENPSNERLSPDDLPPGFGRLSAREIEDCLCIYKDALTRLSSSSLYRSSSAGRPSFAEHGPGSTEHDGG